MSTVTTQIPEEYDSHEVVRILEPRLHQRALMLLAHYPGIRPYLIQEDGRLYISLQFLPSSYQKEQVSRLIQRVQVGETVHYGRFPLPLQPLFQPALSPTNRFALLFIGAVTFGIFCGVLAMAGSVLLFALSELILGYTINTTIVGMEFPSIAFVLASVMGAGLAIVYMNRRLHARWLSFSAFIAAVSSFQMQSHQQTRPFPENGQNGVHMELPDEHPPDAKKSA